MQTTVSLSLPYNHANPIILPKHTRRSRDRSQYYITSAHCLLTFWVSLGRDVGLGFVLKRCSTNGPKEQEVRKGRRRFNTYRDKERPMCHQADVDTHPNANDNNNDDDINNITTIMMIITIILLSSSSSSSSPLSSLLLLSLLLYYCYHHHHHHHHHHYHHHHYLLIRFKASKRDFFLQSLHCTANCLQHVSSRAYHVQHVVLRATWYEETAQLSSLTELKSHLL